MTDPADDTTTGDPAGTASDAHDGTDTPAADETTEGRDVTPNNEAARYRVRLRETEAQRDALAARVTTLQRRECEAALADVLEQPADIWEIGKADIANFYGDDDALLTDELRAAATALLNARPGLAKTHRGPRSWGQHGGPTPGNSTSWNTVIKSV